MDLRTGADELSTAAERRQAAAVVVFGTWMITGLFLDGWSHNHRRPETFFTPWHAVLYSGFVAALAWFAWEGSREKRAGLPPVPAVGGNLTAVGLVVFGVAAVGDFGWHQLFGIERNVAALLSPTHLALMTGGLLMVTGPVRSAWHRGTSRAATWSDDWPVIGSVTHAVMVVSFFLMYISPFRATVIYQPTVVRGSGLNYLVQDSEIRTIAAVLIANTVMVGAMLLVLRRWRPPLGAFTVMFSVAAVAMSGLDSFEKVPLALCAVLGGAAADLLVALLPSPPSQGDVRRLAIAVPVAMWLPYFLVFKIAYHLPWVIHLWLGSVFLTALGGLALSLLAFPPEVPA